MKVVEIGVRHNSDGVKSLRVRLSDGINSVWSTLAGDDSVTEEFWSVPENEHITQINIWHDNLVRAIEFFAINSASNIYGNIAGTKHEEKFEGDLTGTTFMGFHGMAGSYMDAIGLIVRT